MGKLRFNVILDTCPDKGVWAGVVEKTDFKQVLKFFRLLDDETLPDDEKFYWMLKTFFKNVPKMEAREIVEAVEKFISGADDAKSGSGESAKRVFCYNQDAGRLFSAFMQAYKIDLRSASFHWWVFLELFSNLPEDTRLMQIIELRGRKSAKTDSKESKSALRKAQRSVALDVTHGTKAIDDFFDNYAATLQR